MSWVKLDDKFPDHPKIAKVGALGGWMYVCGLAYCNRMLTDGFIPAGQVKRLADVRKPDEIASLLVDAGLWHEVEGGYAVHDYLEYQPSKDSAEDLSRQRAEAGRKGGKQKSSKLLDAGLADASSKPEAKSKPVPVPDIYTLPSTEGRDGVAAWVAFYVEACQAAGVEVPKSHKGAFGEKAKTLGPIDPSIMADAVKRLIDEGKHPGNLSYVYGDCKRVAERELIQVAQGGRNAR